MDIINDWLCKLRIDKSSTELQKRHRIFNYLYKNIEYDNFLMTEIFHNRANRNPTAEFDAVLIHNRGICSSISQVYHVILSAVDIHSACVCCSDHNFSHQLVWFTSTNTFDDLTNAILFPDKAEKYFNYSYQEAVKLGQSKSPLFDDKYWITVPNEWIEHIADHSQFSKYINKYLHRQHVQ